VQELRHSQLAVIGTRIVDSLHVQLADEAIGIGAAPELESYLKIDRASSAAEVGDVDADQSRLRFSGEERAFDEVVESCKIPSSSGRLHT